MEISKLEDQRDAVNEKYDALLDEDKIYMDANKLIQTQNYNEMTNLLKTYGEQWKSVAVLMGEDVSKAIKAQLDELKNAYNYLKGTGTSSSSSSSSSSSGSSSSSSGAISKGTKVKISDAAASIYYDSYGGSVGTWRGAGVSSSEGLYVVNLNNNRAALSRTNNISGAMGWIDLSKVGRYKVGGDVGNWSNNNGRLAMVDSGERVLTAEQNRLFSNLIYDILPKIAQIPLTVFTNISRMYDINNKNKDIPANVEFNNNYNVLNQVPFDVKKYEMNMEQKFKKELLAAGIKTN